MKLSLPWVLSSVWVVKVSDAGGGLLAFLGVWARRPRARTGKPRPFDPNGVPHLWKRGTRKPVALEKRVLGNFRARWLRADLTVPSRVLFYPSSF